MQARKNTYWIATALTAFVFLSGGAAYLFGAEAPARGVAELGYPGYLFALLGILKLGGGAVVLAPGLPRLKEWAYAGITFDLLGAAVSHAAVGHPVGKVMVPLVILAVALTSWALRPADRRVAVVSHARSPQPAGVHA